MPQKKTNKRKIYRKRRYGKKKGPKGSMMTKREKLFLKTPGSIIPDNYFCKLNANDNAAIGATGESPPSAGFPYIHSYAGNSTQNVDVWRNSAIIDANGHDQLSTLYIDERIHASEISVNFVNTSTDIYRCVIFPSTSAQINGNLFSMNDYIEQPYAVFGTLSSINGVGKLLLKGYMSTKRLYGYKDISLNDGFSTTTAITSGQQVPTNAWYWIIAVESMTGATSPAQNVYTEVKITYFSEFYNRLILKNQNEV